MPRTVADRICIRLHEVAEFNLARYRCLAGIVAGIIDSRSVKLNDIAPKFQGKANFMSKYRRLQLFFQQVEFNQEESRWRGENKAETLLGVLALAAA